MGTDIHLVAERRYNEGWRLLPDPIIDCETWLHRASASGGPCFFCKGTGKRSDAWYSNRNYDAFALLANVRNGSGFANTDTGDGFIPISAPRGLPKDFSAEVDEEDSSIYIVEGKVVEDRRWLGYHDHSWVLATEVLALDWKAARTRKRGWVGPEEFVVFQKEGAPSGWCGGVSGKNVRHVSNEEMARGIADGSIPFAGPSAVPDPLRFSSVYTQVEWSATLDDAASDLREAVEHLVALHGPADRLRLVFGFDS